MMYHSSSRLLLVLTILLCSLSLYALPVSAQSTGSTWVEKASVVSPVNGQTRLALILGNTHYGSTHNLKNPENDAKAIAKALAKLGFTSTVLLDGNLDQMSDAVHAFAGKIRSVGTSTVALLYYSGHGIQVNGENYLLPIDFKMPAYDQDMVRYAMSAQSALDEMQEANAQINIAILDACRNNPFAKDRAFGGKGLAKLEAQGMLIAYATAAGTTASDNTNGQNGLYTAALLKYLQTPGLPLTSVFSRTRKAVYEASGKKQFPYVYDGMIDADEFYLLPNHAPGNTIIAKPQAIDTKARLQVTVNAPEAKITVDGTPVSRGIFSTDLLSRRQRNARVKVIANGYEGQLLTVILLRGKTVSLPITLKAIARPIAPVPSSSAPFVPARGQELSSLKGHSDYVNSVAFSPEGDRIASGSYDNTAILWNAPANTRSITRAITLTGHTDSVNSVAFSPDGRFVATGSADKTARIWNAGTGSPLLVITGHEDAINSVAFSPDGKSIVTGSSDRNAKIWDTKTGRLLHTLHGHLYSVNSVAFAPNGKWIVTGSTDNTAIIWNAEAGDEVRTLSGHGNTVFSVAVSSDSKRIVTGSEDKTARVWEAATGKVVVTLQSHSEAINTVAFSPSGRYVVTGSDDRTVKVWNVAEGSEVITLTGSDTYIWSVAFAPNGRRIIAGNQDGTITVWGLQQ